jgi:hypothetical protein
MTRMHADTYGPWSDPEKYHRGLMNAFSRKAANITSKFWELTDMVKVLKDWETRQN